MPSKAEVMQSSRSTLTADNVVGGKIAPALRAEAENILLCVAHHSY